MKIIEKQEVLLNKFIHFLDEKQFKYKTEFVILILSIIGVSLIFLSKNY